MGTVLAIDVGGTKTLLAVYDGSGTVLEQIKFPTPGEYPVFIEELTKSVASLTTKEYEVCVSALPGRVDREAGIGVAFGNLEWENIPYREDLGKIVRCPVYIENDANLAGLAEALLVPQYRKVQYVTISTGIGGAYVVDGKLDPELIDAEIGQMMMEHDGQLLTWEHLASGKAITAKFGMRASDITDERAWYIIARNIAIGLIGVIATTNPDVVIFGGGVGSHYDKFKEKLLSELEIYKADVVRLPDLMKAQNPEEAVINGCFAYAQQVHHA